MIHGEVYFSPEARQLFESLHPSLRYAFEVQLENVAALVQNGDLEKADSLFRKSKLTRFLSCQLEDVEIQFSIEPISGFVLVHELWFDVPEASTVDDLPSLSKHPA